MNLNDWIGRIKKPVFIETILWFCMMLCIFLGFGFTVAFASEPVVITADGEYVMGNGETMEVAEERAKKAAIQKAAEQAGAYVKSYTKVKNLALESDVIEVIANHSMKVEVIEKKKSVLGDVDAIRFYVKIKATMTQEEIEANLKKVREDQSIVEAYNRLKAEFEKQDKEMAKLKRQLEFATAGDKQKIAKLISEEEKKYKANLWLERAQEVWDTDEKLKAYEKALEFNPDLPQAYLGIAKAMIDKHIGEPSSDKEREDKLDALRDAVESINRAIALDENYADAYALRADTLHKIKWMENQDENKKDYDERILKDISRALALNASNKGDLYYLRASIYLEELHDAELEQAKTDQYNYEVIEDYLNKALKEIDMAVSLCKEEDLACLAENYRKKASAYSVARAYYIRRGNKKREKVFEDLRNKFIAKAEEVEKREEAKLDETISKEEALFSQYVKSEYGKIEYYLFGGGWEERVAGVSFKEMRQKSEDEREKKGKELISKLEKKISSGTASAEEYLFMSYRVEPPLKEEYFKKGISLLEKRNPQGIDLLLLVYLYLSHGGNYDVQLSYLSKAKKIVDKNLSQAQKALSINEVISLSSEMEKAKSDTDRADVTKKLAKLNKEQAEAFYWFAFAAQISNQKAEIYERLDLPQKAREEYLYLCNTFKDDRACKNAERLKK
ncbi:hypothetical protein V4D30_07180 [Thermodesulfovibrio sp. 3907-1M]|uniref:Tetratricopeptide repeat protein n=1 Tax=Thermodesulfovibrio autotrophicus TaxID=3118333 RepID=A0AAU8GXU5_9BACT